jgi:uncharacterized protein DUF5648
MILQTFGGTMKSRRTTLALRIAGACLLLNLATGQAAELLDESFGQGGLWRAPSNLYPGVGVYEQHTRDASTFVVVDAIDGSSRALVRMREDGTPDRTFGIDGYATLPRLSLTVTSFGTDHPYEPFLAGVLGEDERGRILVTLGAGGDSFDRDARGGYLFIVLARLMPDGFLDRSFGEGGILKVRAPARIEAEPCAGMIAFKTVKFVPGGIIVAGTRYAEISSRTPEGFPVTVEAWSCAALVKLRDDGTLDSSFGGAGLAQAPIRANASAYDLSINADATLMVTGLAATRRGRPAVAGEAGTEFFRWLLTQGGNTLATSTSPMPVLPPTARFIALTADRSGGWVGAAQSGQEGIVFVRDAEGRPGASFGTDGQVAFTLPSYSEVMHVGRTPEGGAYVAGLTIDAVNRPLFCRWTASGAADPALPSACVAVAGGPESLRPLHFAAQADGSLLMSAQAFRSAPADGIPFAGYAARSKAAPDIVEFHNTLLDHYFLTYDGAEARGIDMGAAGEGWVRTGARFAPGGSAPVCRFRGTPGIGPNSHFFSADPAECEQVKKDPGWTYEGLGFFTTPAPAQKCTAPLRPVHRLYNGRARVNDSNHRYITDMWLVPGLTARGWAYEGIAFCARP